MCRIDVVSETAVRLRVSGDAGRVSSRAELWESEQTLAKLVELSNAATLEHAVHLAGTQVWAKALRLAPFECREKVENLLPDEMRHALKLDDGRLPRQFRSDVIAAQRVAVQALAEAMG